MNGVFSMANSSNAHIFTFDANTGDCSFGLNSSSGSKFTVGNNRVNARNSSNSLKAQIVASTGLVRYTSLTQLSDDRLKHNETPITDAVAVLSKLQPVNYMQMSDPLGGDLSDAFKDSGFIAQDVETIPELKHLVDVSDEDETYSLRYTGLISWLVAAVKELTQKVELLEEKTLTLTQNMLS